MKKAVFMGLMLVVILSLFAISALMVSAAPTPPGSRDMFARPTPRTSIVEIDTSSASNLLQGLSYSLAGNIEGEAPCSRQDLSGLYAYPSFMQSGESLEIPASTVQDLDLFGPLPGICSAQQIDANRWQLYSPDGEVLVPPVVLLPQESGVRATPSWFGYIPIEAFAQPGTWGLAVRGRPGFAIQIEIPEPDGPFMATMQGQYVIGDLQPEEHVIGVILDDDPVAMKASYLGDFEVQTNEFGYASLFVEQEHAAIFFVGESGEVISNSPGVSDWGFDEQAFADLLVDTYWPNRAVTAPASPTPARALSTSLSPDIRVDYAPDWLALTNVSGANLDMTGLTFSSSVGAVSIAVWDTAWLGQPLNNFRTNDCLQIFNFSIDQPPAPAGCNYVQGWIATGETNQMFWRVDFTVTRNGIQVASCRAADGTCAFSIE